MESELTIEDTYGITDAEVQRIEEEMGFQFGIPNITQIQNGIKQTSDNTLTFNKQVKTARKFPINSDKCGSTCITLFTKIFIVNLTYYKSGFLRTVHETKSQFREETQHVDCQVSRRELTDDFGCDKLTTDPVGGTVRLSWGLLSVLSPFSYKYDGILKLVTDVGNIEFPFSLLTSTGIIRVVDRNVIPKMYRFLSRDNSERYKIHIAPHLPEGAEYSAAMSPEREKAITEARMLQEQGIFPVADISDT